MRQCIKIENVEWVLLVIREDVGETLAVSLHPSKDGDPNMCEYEQKMFLLNNISIEIVQLQGLLWYHCFFVLKYVTILLQLVTNFTLRNFLWRKDAIIMQVIDTHD